MLDTKHWYPKQENIFSILSINKIYLKNKTIMAANSEISL